MVRPPFYCLAASKSIKSYALPNQEAATESEVLVRELASLFRDSSRTALLSRKKFRIAFVLHYPFSFIPLSIIIIITLLLYSSSCTRSSSLSVPPSPAATATPRAAPRPALAGQEFPANFNEHLLVHGRPVLPRGLCLLPNKRADNAHCVLFKCAPLAIYLWELGGGGLLRSLSWSLYTRPRGGEYGRPPPTASLNNAARIAEGRPSGGDSCTFCAGAREPRPARRDLAVVGIVKWSYVRVSGEY